MTPEYRQRLAELSDEALEAELARRKAERRAAKRAALEPPPARPNNFQRRKETT